MKLARLLLFVVGGLALLALLAAGVAFTPAVQRWAVARAVAAQPGLKLEFARLAAGPSGAELRDVTLERPGLRLRLARLDVDYVLWRFLLHRRLEVRQLTVRGLEIDATQLSSSRTRAGAAGGPAAAPGAIAQVKLPWELVIGQIDVRGRALLPAAPGQPALPADFELTGGNLAPGREGRFVFRATAKDAAPNAPVAALHASGELRVRETAARSFDQAELTLTLDAEGPRLTHENQLKLTARLAPSAAGAAYTLRLDTVQGGDSQNLLTVDATAPASEPRFGGKWALQARHTQFEPFFFGAPLPRFRATGAGTFTFHPDKSASSIEGEIDGEAGGLEVFAPALRALGTVKLASRFDVGVAGSVVQLNRLAGRVAGEKPVLEFEVKRALALDLPKRLFQIGGGDGEVARVKLAGVPLAWVRPFVSAIDVSGGVVTGEFVVTGDARQLRVASSEPLHVAPLSLVQRGRLFLDRADLALGLEATLTQDAATLAVRDLALATPAGDRVRLDFTAEQPLTGERRALAVKAKGEADLPCLLEPFVPVGHIRAVGEADVSVSRRSVDVRGFRSEWSTGAGRKLFAAVGEKPFAFDLQALRLAPRGTEEAELARVTFDRIALADFPQLQQRLPVRGEVAPGGFVIAAQGNRLFFRPTSPLQFSQLAVSSGNRRLVEGLSIQTSPTLEFGHLADWKLSDGATALGDASGASLIDLNLEAGASAEGVRATASFNADLAALGGQPALASLRALSAGRASGELRAAVAGRAVQIEARSTMNGLVAREGNQALPVANLSLRAVRTEDGRVSLNAPLLLDRLGQRSELRLTAEAVPQGGVLNATARLEGGHLELADALALLALASGEGEPPAAPANAKEPARPAAASVAADTKPFWSAVRGELTVDVKEIVRGTDWSMKDFAAVARAEAEAVRVEKLGGTINERGALSGRAELAFRGGAQPYALQGEFALSEFDVGALLKAFDPEKPPTLEGVFAVQGKFAGAGRTLDHTLERTGGNFEMKSQSGVFRGLRRTSEKVSVATKAVDAVAALGSLLRSNKVKEAAEKVAGQTYQVDQLAQALAELPFDQFVVRAQRDEQLNFRIEELSLLSPDVRLSAKGAVTHVEGKPLLEQPLTLNYQLAARGKVEQTLGRLRALDGTKDELGYAKTKDLGTITGTLARPQPNEFYLRLLESKLGDFLN